MWAYPGDDINPDLLISSGTIKLAVSIAGIVYLIANVSADYNIIEGVKRKTGSSLVDTLPRKMIFVIFLIGLLTLGSLDNNSFMNYRQQLYKIKPINDYKKPDFWHYNQTVNKNMNDELDDNNNIKYPQTGIYETCIIDDKGQINVQYNDIDGNIDTQIKQSSFKSDALENLKTNDDKFKNYYDNVSKLWDDNKPCFVPDKSYICNKKVLNNTTTFGKDTNKVYDTAKLCKKDNFNNTASTTTPTIPLLSKYHINSGNLAKKADMGIFKLYAKETKYDIMNKSKGIFNILFIFIYWCLSTIFTKWNDI